MICVGSMYEHDAADRWLNIRVSNFEELEKVLQNNLGDTVFVFWMGVSNITGEIFPVKDIGRLCHKYNAFYICDATALLGHVAIEPDIDDWCDLLVLDGHKAGTELGIGCYWISDRLNNWLNGFSLHGTPNLAGALALTQAVENACDSRNLDERTIRYNELQNYLIGYLVGANIDFQLVPEYDEQPSGHEFTSAINAIRLHGFNADSLQQFLASKQIYIGVGHSSCSDNSDFRILEQGYGLSKQEASEVIRVSFGEDSTVKDVKTLVDNIVSFKKEYVND